MGGVEPTRVPGSPEGEKRGKKNLISGHLGAQSARVLFFCNRTILYGLRQKEKAALSI